jgi:Family of unknown function (DUF6159)
MRHDDPRTPMRGLARGWKLARRSLAVLRRDPSLAVFPALAAVAAVVAFVVLAAPGAVWAAAIDAWWPLIPFAAIAVYVATYCGVYFNVALAVAVSESLDGRDPNVKSALAAARARRGVIARWTLLQTTVGILLHALSGIGGSHPVGRIALPIASRLAGAAWAIATFFVIPLLAFENVGPKAALKRSAALVRERWGEGVAGTGAIALAVVIAGLVPATVLIVVAVTIGGTAAPLILAAIAAAVVTAAAVAGAALSAIFRVILYRFARDEAALGGFDAAELTGAVRATRRRAQPAL